MLWSFALPRRRCGDPPRLGSAAVFVDEAAEYVDPIDMPDVPDTGGYRACRLDGHIEVDAAVRTGGVVVRNVLVQYVFEVAAVADQDLVEAFGPDGAYPPLGVGIPRSAPVAES